MNNTEPLHVVMLDKGQKEGTLEFCVNRPLDEIVEPILQTPLIESVLRWGDAKFDGDEGGSSVFSLTIREDAFFPVVFGRLGLLFAESLGRTLSDTYLVRLEGSLLSRMQLGNFCKKVPSTIEGVSSDWLSLQLALLELEDTYRES